MRDIRLLTVDEVAEFFRVSKSTIYRWVERRAIPFYKFERELRFSEKDVIAFLEKAKGGHESLTREPTYQPPRDINAKRKQGYLTTEEVAELFGTTTQRVSQMLQSGMIGCTRVSGKRLFYELDMQSFLKEEMKKTPAERFYINKNKAHIKKP